MLEAEDEVEQYFGYNSIMTVEGKRVRRLRRTQISSQKIAMMRSKSPSDSQSIGSKKFKIRESKSSQINTPLVHNRSKLLLKCVHSFPSGAERHKQSVHSQYNHFPIIHQFSTQMSINTDKGPNVKDKVGSYYLGNTSFQKKGKNGQKRSLSRTQEQKKTGKSAQKNQYLAFPPNMPKQKLKNIESIKNPEGKNGKQLPISNPDYTNEDTSGDYQSQVSQKQISKMSLKESIRSKSKSRLKISKSNSKLSKSSSFAAISPNKQSEVRVEGASSYMSENYQVKSSKNIESQAKKSQFQKNFTSSVYESQSQMKSDSNIKSSEMGSGNSKFSMAQKPMESNYSGGRSKNEKISRQQSKISSRIKSKIQIRKESKLSQLSKKSSCSIQCKQKSKIEKKIEENTEFWKTAEKIDMTKKSTATDSMATKENFFIPKMKKIQTFGGNESDNKDLSELKKSEDKASVLHSDNKKQRKSALSKIASKISEKRKSDIQSNKSSSSLRSSKKSQSNRQVPIPKAPEQFTIEDLLGYVDEHDIRIGFLYLFVDNTHTAYETPITFERYERLCFLMMKKYLYEKNRLIQALKGGQNCMKLTDVIVHDSVLQKFCVNKEIKTKVIQMMEESKEIFKDMEEEYHKLHRKYPKDKIIKLESPKDNFTKEIMKLLMQELTKLYQQLQSDDPQNDSIDSSEERIIEIIEIMFMISELHGRPVKSFELLDQNMVEFDDYYSTHYEKIIETTEYFDKLKE